MKFNAMFQPINIGPMTVKNRFVVPPMGNNFANTDGSMSEQSAAYYRERAKGGFGLITIEATVVHKGAKGGPRNCRRSVGRTLSGDVASCQALGQPAAGPCGAGDHHRRGRCCRRVAGEPAGPARRQREQHNGCGGNDAGGARETAQF